MMLIVRCVVRIEVKKKVMRISLRRVPNVQFCKKMKELQRIVYEMVGNDIRRH